jgi:hypothetical protein
MNKLEAELQRLYFLPGQEWHSLKSETDSPEIDLITTTGLVRCFVISVENGCAWSQVAALYEGVQDELDLPAPAISVSVEEGYQIWFSLAEPVALQLAQEFMGSLIRHYLTETKATKLKLRPGMANDLKSVPQVPAKQESSDRWSAYIDPTMGSMFVEETWLEMAPNLDKQAAMLAGLKSIGTEDFDQALKTLQTIREKISSPEPHPPVEKAESAQRCPPTTLGIGGGFSNPKSFLLAVMNDSVASAEQRMAAAVALLPFFENDAGQ